MKLQSVRKFFSLAFPLAALLGICVGVFFALHSRLFLVQVVEVANQLEDSPVSAQAISQLAAVPVGEVNLFELDLSAVEKRILTHPWIRQVRLQKRFPQTLVIEVVFRDPQALLEQSTGALTYVDVDGRIFGRVNVLARSNLPLLNGISADDSTHLRQALDILKTWDRSIIRKSARLSSLGWDVERGYHIWLIYALNEGRGVQNRVMIELGREPEINTLELQFVRLNSVVRYLSQHSVMAKQIWADSGKKIVVRTARGS